MHRYDYSFLRDMNVPIDFLNITNAIYSLKTIEEEKKKNYPDIFTNLQKIAIVQSVQGSNAIEGIVTTDKRIEEIVNQNSDPINHTEREIAGYKDALSIVHNNFSDISFSVDSIKYLHGVMLEHTDLMYRGEFKQEDNVIREKYPDGTSKIRFVPEKAANTSDAMQQLVYAYMAARDDSRINQ